MRARMLLWMGVGVLLLAACAGAAPTPHPTVPVPTLAPQPTRNPQGDAANGAALFVAWRCADCHGADARGRLGPALAGTSLRYEDFTAAIRQTRPPKPAFSEAELSELDVRDMYVWVQSLGSPGGQAVSLAPGEVLGIQLYTQSGCDACHGAFAQGGPDAPPLAGYPDHAEAFLAAMQDTAGEIAGHDVEAAGADLLRRLHRWLQEGANLESGC